MICKRFLRKFDYKESGMILPLALVLLVAATLIILPGLRFMYSLLTTNSIAQQDVAAYYAADSGISAVYWYFNKNSGAAPTWPYAVTINGLTVSVTQLAHTSASDNSSDNYTIQSTALIGTTPRATVVANINIPAAGNNIFNQAVASLNGPITMSGGAKTISDSTSNYGNIYANGNISLQPSAIVGGTNCPSHGLAYATGTVTGNGSGGACAGSTKNGQAQMSYTLTISNFTGLADAGTNYTAQAASWSSGGPATYNVGPGFVNGNVTIAGANTVVLHGNLHVKGTLSINGSAVIKGPYTVISDGNLSVGGAALAVLAAGNIPFFICSGTTVTIGGSAEIAAVIYAPGAAASLSGGVGPDGYNVYGAVIAKSVTIAGSATVKYLTGIHSETFIPGAGAGGTPVLIGYNYR